MLERAIEGMSNIFVIVCKKEGRVDWRGEIVIRAKFVKQALDFCPRGKMKKRKETATGNLSEIIYHLDLGSDLIKRNVCSLRAQWGVQIGKHCTNLI